MKLLTALLGTITMFFSCKLHCQNASQDTIYKRGFQVHPFQRQIGYRSNLDKKHFIDFKGGMAFTAIPYLALELNVLRRSVNKKQTKVYWGTGVSIEDFVIGLQFPIGIEFSPIANYRQLSIITEIAPRLSYSPNYFFNLQFYPHLGVCYYLKTKSYTSQR